MHENKLKVEKDFQGWKSSLSKILAIKEGLLWLLILSLKTK
jgi:hypothetical protein